MNLLQRIVSRPAPGYGSYDVSRWLDDMSLGLDSPFLRSSMRAEREEVGGDFIGLAAGAYRGNGVVFTCIATRMALFSEMRFQFQELSNGPGRLFGNEDLRLLEAPEPGHTTGDLLARMELDVSLAGNGYVVRRPGRLKRLRPDWVGILVGVPDDDEAPPDHPDSEVLGYSYSPGGIGVGKPMFFDRMEVCHYAPYPDPEAHYRGMSWLTPVLRDVMSDGAATRHKLAFFENAATPNVIVKLTGPKTPKEFNEWVEFMEREKAGVRNAYKTWYLGAGADPMIVGANLQQMDFKVTQGAGETRIANASGLSAVTLGLSEGLQGSNLNDGNQMAARRLDGDKTIRPLWRNVCGSLQTITVTPGGSRLWYDDADVSFMQEDIKDKAEVRAKDAAAIRTLTDAGYTPESVVDAVTSGDLKLLVHTGTYSVQLQPPGSGDPTRALVERAEARLVERGVRPTAAAIAEELDMSERTIRRWKAA